VNLEHYPAGLGSSKHFGGRSGTPRICLGCTEKRLGRIGLLKDSLKHRLPWVYLNLATVFLVAIVVSVFESTIVKVAGLAIFMPIVAG